MAFILTGLLKRDNAMLQDLIKMTIDSILESLEFDAVLNHN